MTPVTRQSDQAIHVVVTCANRKRHPASDQLQLRTIRARDLDSRYDAWVTRLASRSPVVPAHQMYAGEHWHVAKTLGTTTNPGASLWVCSAGYGLLSSQAPIDAYAATFAFGQKDSVVNNTEDARRWWTRLATWAGPEPGQPRSFAELAKRAPDAVIVAVLSEAYLRACADDLREAAALMTNSDNLSVIGPRGRCPEVDDLVVPVTAALRSTLGGSLLSLNVRAAASMLSAARTRGIPYSRPSFTRLMADATAEAPAKDERRRPPGVRLTDDEVRRFIRESLALGPNSATGLLRQLRSSGRSCEQARFKALFIEVASTGVLP